MKDAIRLLIQDKPVFGLSVSILVLAAAYITISSFMIHASDLQVVIHYSSFGETNFYRDRWYYLVTFIGMGALVALTHIGIMGKLLTLEKRHVAIVVGWMTIVLIVVAFLLTKSVLQVASLV